jgi:hypothetical protein
MKKIFFIFSLIFSVYSFGQLPPEFPKKLINKVFCGTASTINKNRGNYIFLDFPYRLTISADGIFAEFNPKQKFKEDAWGKTQTINKFVEWKRVPDYDQYDDLLGRTIYYKVSSGNEKYSISDFSIYVPANKSRDNYINVKVYVPSYEATTLDAYENLICETLKSKEEIAEEKKQAEIKEKKEIAEEKKQAEIKEKKIKDLIKEIDALIPLNIIEASKKWDFNKDLLLSSSLASNTLNNLISSLNDYYADKIVNIDAYITEGEIQKNSVLLKSISDGNYEIIVNPAKKTTQPSEFKDFQISNLLKDTLSGACCNVIKPYSFNVKLSSQDSILLETKYFSSSKKPIYKKDEKTFCFKSKSILSTVSFVFDPTIPKGQIKIEKTYKYEKYANGLVIKTRQYNNKSENRIVLKKDKG